MNADVPWAMAGPSGADSAVRYYSHDAWNSVSSTIKLPAKGSVIGALAPVLTPGEAGERRSFLVAFPILRQSAADRRTANSEWAADLGEELRRKAKVKQRAKQPRRNRQGPRRRRQAGPRQVPSPARTRCARSPSPKPPGSPSSAQARRRGAARRVSRRCGSTCPTTSGSPPPPSPSASASPAEATHDPPTPGIANLASQAASALVVTSPGCSPTSGTASRRSGTSGPG